jgi:hypothetical protein
LPDVGGKIIVFQTQQSLETAALEKLTVTVTVFPFNDLEGPCIP